MPSPVGHALGALAVGWTIAGGTAREDLLKRTVWIAGIGLAPDLDLLIGRHSMETHSLGAALIVGGVAAWLRWPLASGRARIFLTTALARMSHPILDSMGTDTSSPNGVMLFWPISSEHVVAVPVFDPISRRWWVPGFALSIAQAVVRELLILGPIAFGAWWWARWKHGSTRPPQSYE
jgi:membrane-bound metal-dependent hydrolase YbcI (DUF457 family)